MHTSQMVRGVGEDPRAPRAGQDPRVAASMNVPMAEMSSPTVPPNTPRITAVIADVSARISPYSTMP